MDILYLQLIVMAIIFITTTGIGLSPVLLGKYFQNKLSLKTQTKSRILADASCFGAGVFLFVCFLGLLPAADRKFHVFLEALEESAFSEFPWGFFVVTCGFLVIFAIDKLVHAVEETRTRKKENREINANSIGVLEDGKTKQIPEKNTHKSTYLSFFKPSLKNSFSPKNLENSITDNSISIVSEYKPNEESKYDDANSIAENYPKKENSQEDAKKLHSVKSESDNLNEIKRKSLENKDFRNGNYGSVNGIDDSQQLSILKYECHIEACGIYEEGNGHGHAMTVSVMFLVAMGLHSMFEGVAVGLQHSKEKIVEFSVAVLVHEIVMALTFGIEVSKSATLKRTRKILYVMLFTSSIPVGILIGVGLQNTPSEHRQLISAIIEAFATGIFLHVIFIEILSNEFGSHTKFDRHKCKLSKPNFDSEVETTNEIKTVLEKLFCIGLGLILMILISVFLHGHSH